MARRSGGLAGGPFLITLLLAAADNAPLLDPIVQVAIVVGFFGVLTGVGAPVLLAILTGRQRAAEKEQDFARQDLVAQRAEEVAQRQQAAAEEVAAVARQSAAAAADAAAAQARASEAMAAAAVTAAHEATEARVQIGGQLQAIGAQAAVIHTLVNSNLTEEMSGRLVALKANLASLNEIIDLKRASGANPTAPAKAAVAAAEQDISELTAKLEDRRRQQLIVVGQQKAAAAMGIAVPLGTPDSGPIEVRIVQKADEAVRVEPKGRKATPATEAG